MSRIKSKFIKWGTGSGDVNSREIPANYTPTAYTPTAVGSEGTTQVSAHLKGINNALNGLGAVTTDIGLTSWTGLANNTSNQVITGFLIDQTVRSFTAEVDVYIDNGGTGVFLHAQLMGVKRTTGAWSAYEINMVGVGDDITGLAFDINNVSNDGQVRISIGNISGFVSGQLLFRVITLK